MITSRRNFLKAAGAAGAVSLAFPSVLGAPNPGRKLNIAAIGGGGGKGESDLSGAAEGNNVVAICDVDRDRLAKALLKYNLPSNRGFTDFRRMLDTVKEIEGCTVSPADHAHFPAAMHAIALGKHVCVQKPLVNSLWQAHELHRAAKKKHVVTNMGNQGHTGEGVRLLKEWVKQGAIGKVTEIHVWTNRPVWPQGNSASYPKGKPTPANLDWEAWQAGASSLPFIDGLHPFSWRGNRVYGAGAMGDMGCHLLDGPFWALDLGAPSRIVPETVNELGVEAYPKGAVISCHFPQKGIILRWYEGRGADDKSLKPPQPAEYDRQKPWAEISGGFIMRGDKGIILDTSDYCQQPALLPAGKHSDFMATNPKKTLARSTHPGNPQAEWTNAIKNGLVCGSNFDYAVPLTELCLLGNLAMLAGAPIEWNGNRREVKGRPDLSRFIKRPVYNGYDYRA